MYLKKKTTLTDMFNRSSLLSVTVRATKDCDMRGIMECSEQTVYCTSFRLQQLIIRTSEWR